MKYDKDLLKLIEEKNFKTFWNCLDYLLMAGYTPMDAFGVSLKHFGESKIYSSVAFVRMERIKDPLWLGLDTHREPKRPNLVVGLIDDTNIHLDSFYTVYRKMLMDQVTESFEIESTCEVIKTTQLTPFIINYLVGLSKKHFGIESFFIPTGKIVNMRPPQDDDLQTIIRRLQEQIDRPIFDPDNQQNGWPAPATRHEAKIINFADEMRKRREGDEL